MSARLCVSIWFGALLCVFCGIAAAQEKLTVASLQNPQKLNADEVRALVTGAGVTSVSAAGSVRRWDNDASGKFVASSRAVGARVPGQGQGSWHVSPEGQYCVTIDWRGSSENWCRFILKSGEKYYGASTDRNPSAAAYEMEFRK